MIKNQAGYNDADIQGVGKERVMKHVTNGLIPVWDSRSKPWKKIYITEEEFERLSKIRDGL